MLLIYWFSVLDCLLPFVVFIDFSSETWVNFVDPLENSFHAILYPLQQQQLKLKTATKIRPFIYASF